MAENRGSGKFGVEVKYITGGHVIEWFESEVSRDRYFTSINNNAVKNRLKTVKKKNR